MAEHDLVVRGGTVIDGTGAPRRTADVAVSDGVVVEVGAVEGTGRREIDADGALVVPGFVDVHTHYDGQATWEATMQPSSWHGVTTVVFGNCGVGFAPVHDTDHERLVQLMEGVEDIPEVVMKEGLPWNWASFPDYLDSLEDNRYDVDVATQVPHAALRVFVMGKRGANREDATADDRAEMARIAAEGMRAGAFGFSTSRLLQHRTAEGEPIPSYGAAQEELLEIADALADVGRGWIQTVGDFEDAIDAEFNLRRQLAERPRCRRRARRSYMYGCGPGARCRGARRAGCTSTTAQPSTDCSPPPPRARGSNTSRGCTTRRSGGRSTSAAGRFASGLSRCRL